MVENVTKRMGNILQKIFHSTLNMTSTFFAQCTCTLNAHALSSISDGSASYCLHWKQRMVEIFPVDLRLLGVKHGHIFNGFEFGSYLKKKRFRILKVNRNMFL